MSTKDRDIAWDRYVTAKRLRVDDPECQRLFDNWWRLERADAAEAWNSQKRKDRKTAAKALSGS